MQNPKFVDLNLNTALLNALDDLGFIHTTTIQHKVFPIAMSGADVCGIAQTGTGKTIAYLLPCLRQWKYDKAKNPQILILVPTRELVTQVVAVVENLSSYLSLTAVGVYGGVNMNTQKLALENGADVIVATPGRFFDLVMCRALKTKFIKRMVIDEVDEMLNLGFRPQLKNIFELLPETKQNLLFSATITPEVEALINDYFKAPIKVEAAPTGTPLSNIEQGVYQLPNFNTKLNFLKMLLQNDELYTKVLVFTASKKMADLVFEAIQNLFPEQVGVIHSNKEQNNRFNTVKQFTNGNYRILIATDIVARGIDVAEVSHVINMDVPAIAENYIHRIGRTGRADKIGNAISFVTEKEMPLLENIEALMQLKINELELPAELEISQILIDDEKPKVFMKLPSLRLPSKEESGPAFHQKSAKNSKVNVKVRHKDLMQAKYGKPKKRRPKK
jgi:ATP-dependent RNA helicase RhlE